MRFVFILLLMAAMCSLSLGGLPTFPVEVDFPNDAIVEFIDDEPKTETKTEDLFPNPIEAWMADVNAVLKKGSYDFQPFTFCRISDYHRYFESASDNGLVVIQLNVTDDLLPRAINIEMQYWDKSLSATEQEHGIALMKAALLACITVTDPAMGEARAQELADILGEWVQEALARGVNMGHDEQEGQYHYSAMNDVFQHAAGFSIHRYPIYAGSLFDGMDTDVLAYEEPEMEEPETEEPETETQQEAIDSMESTDESVDAN